jgi:hypothetical protein
MAALLQLDWIHAVLGLALCFLAYKCHKAGIAVPVLNPDPAKPDGGFVMPTFLPHNPGLNVVVQTVVGKLMSGEKLLDGEATIANQFRTLIDTMIPGLARLIDSIPVLQAPKLVPVQAIANPPQPVYAPLPAAPVNPRDPSASAA